MMRNLNAEREVEELLRRHLGGYVRSQGGATHLAVMPLEYDLGNLFVPNDTECEIVDISNLVAALGEMLAGAG